MIILLQFSWSGWPIRNGMTALAIVSKTKTPFGINIYALDFSIYLVDLWDALCLDVGGWIFGVW